MEKTIRILSIVLVAQLLLAVGMSLTGPNLVAAHPNTPLFTLGDQPVDHLTIEGPDGARIVLAKQGEGWVLPDNGGYPADKTRVDTLLSRLKGLQRGLPVATTSGALKRFKVSDESFERRVLLAHGDDTLATLYLGSSPGMHHVHARSGKDDAVYAVDFAVYEAPDKAADWEDRTILQFPQDSLETIDVAGLTLHRLPVAAADTGADTSGANGEGKPAAAATWQVAAAGQGEVVNPAGAQDLAGKLAQLRIGAVLGTEVKPDYGLDKPALTLSVTRKGGEQLAYRLGPTGKEGYAVLKSSARPEYFRIPGYTADALIKAAGRAQLVQAAPAPAVAAPAAAGKPADSTPGSPEEGAANPAGSAPGVTDRQGASEGDAS
jgi:Domain of unknown function (DUF4340)